MKSDDSARSGRADASAKAPGMLRKAGCHECRGLLVAHADVANLIFASAQRLDERVDPVADNPKDMRHPPIDQSFDNDIGGV